MKKLFISILVLSLAFSLCGCGERESAPQPDTSADNMTEAITEISTEEAIEESESTESATETDTAESATERVILDLENITSEGENVFTCTYADINHDFILCLPEETKNAPLVVMLHGNGGNAKKFKTDVALDVEANAAGYAVCYVTGALDSGFLIALAEYLKTEYSFDENRIYAAGFSNGGCVIHSLAMEAGDTYSGFVSVAGCMQPNIWESPNTSNDISFFQITGEKDNAVPKNSDGSGSYSMVPAIEDVMDYWASSNGLSLSDTINMGVDNESELTKYTSSEKKNQVWHLLVKNGRHSWPTLDSYEIDTNSLILEFFESIQ